jgi:hypothetical protein
MSEPGDVHWAPVVAILACGTCLSSIAAGVTALAAGVVGAFWAKWLPVAILVAVLAAWLGGVVDAPRRELRCE